MKKINLLIVVLLHFNILLTVNNGIAQSGSGFISDKNGKGCKVFTDTNSIVRTNEWTGKCLNGLATGIGTLNVYEKGATLFTYQGNMVNGKKNGAGQIIYADSRKFTGQFKNDKKEGQGIMMAPQGTILKGEWKNDFPWNAVFTTSSDTATLSFTIKEGKRDPIALIITKDSVKQTVVFSNDFTQSFDFQEALVAKKQSFAKLNIHEYDNKVDTQKINLFKNPLSFYENGKLIYYDAFYFTTTKEGNLFWSVNDLRSIDTWFILTEKNGKYFGEQRAQDFPRFPGAGGMVGGMSTQASTILKANTDYIIWFGIEDANKMKPVKQGIPFKVTLNLVTEETGRMSVSKFFRGLRLKRTYFDTECNRVDEPQKASFIAEALYKNDSLSTEDMVTFYTFPSMVKVSEGYYRSISPAKVPMDGVIKNYYPNGKVKGYSTWKNGQLNGEYKNYYDTGVLWEEGNIADGLTNGIYKVYYENGQLWEMGKDANGYRVAAKQWDRDGRYLGDIVVPPGTKSADVSFWYGSGICTF